MHKIQGGVGEEANIMVGALDFSDKKVQCCYSVAPVLGSVGSVQCVDRVGSAGRLLGQKGAQENDLAGVGKRGRGLLCGGLLGLIMF
jgi:hypothetical protein